MGLVHYLSFSSQKAVQETVLAHTYNVPTNQNIFVCLCYNNHKDSIAANYQNSNDTTSLMMCWITFLLPIATNSFIASYVALGTHKGKKFKYKNYKLEVN